MICYFIDIFEINLIKHNIHCIIVKARKYNFFVETKKNNKNTFLKIQPKSQKEFWLMRFIIKMSIQV